MPRTTRFRDSGFSFVELLAYMAIAALLVLAAIPQFENYRARAADTLVQGDLRNVGSYLEGLATENPAQGAQVGALPDGSLPLTKRAYANEHRVGMAMCANATGAAAIAESKSGRVYAYSTFAGGVSRLAITEIPLNDACAAAGIRNTSSGYSGTYVHTYADWSRFVK